MMDPSERYVLDTRLARAERAERFARLWKRMAKTLMDRSWYQHGHKHGVAEERALVVAFLSAVGAARLASYIQRGEHLKETP